MSERKLGGLEMEGQLLLEKVLYVLLDGDNTLVDSATKAIEELKRELIERFGPEIDLSFKIEDAKGWDQLTRWAVQRGMSYEDANTLEWLIWKRESVITQANPINGAVELITELAVNRRKGVGVFTSRPHDQRIWTQTWVGSHVSRNLNIPVFIREDDSISGDEYKASVALQKAREYGTILFVEDSPDHVSKILSETNGYNVYGILVPYADVDMRSELSKHPRLKVIPRGSWDNGLWRVHKYLGFKSS